MRTIVILFLSALITARAHADALDTWTNVATSPYGDFHQIAFGNGQFQAVSGPYSPYDSSGGPTGLAGSGDGLHWGYSSSSYGIDGVAFGNSTFVWSVSFGDGGEIMWLSPTNSGSTFGSFSPSITQLNCVAYGNGIFVAVGFEYEGGDFGAAYISTNGQSWSQEIKIGNNFYPTAFAYGNGVFVATGHAQQFPYTNMMFESWDGTGRNWVDETPYVGFSFSGISFVNGLFATSGPGGYYTTGDPDEDPWTKASGPIPNIYVPTSGNNHLYVSVGGSGTVYTSPDRTTWTQRTTGITNNLTCIAYGDNRFIAAGANGKIFASGNTIPSLSVQSQSTNGIQLFLTGGLGPTYHLQASTDLSHWTNLTVFTNIGPGTNYLDTNAGNFTQRYYRTISP